MASVEYGYITSLDKYRWKDEEDEIPVAGGGYVSALDPTSEQVSLILAFAKSQNYGVAIIEISEPKVVIPLPQPEPTVPGTIVENTNGDKYIRTDREANSAWLRFSNMSKHSLDSIYFVSWPSVGTVAKVNLPTDKA